MGTRLFLKYGTITTRIIVVYKAKCIGDEIKLRITSQ